MVAVGEVVAVGVVGVVGVVAGEVVAVGVVAGEVGVVGVVAGEVVAVSVVVGGVVGGGVGDAVGTGVHEVAPYAEYVPLGQGWHADELPAKVFGSHCQQTCVPATIRTPYPSWHVCPPVMVSSAVENEAMAYSVPVSLRMSTNSVPSTFWVHRYQWPSTCTKSCGKTGYTLSDRSRRWAWVWTSEARR